MDFLRFAKVVYFALGIQAVLAQEFFQSNGRILINKSPRRQLVLPPSEQKLRQHLRVGSHHGG